MSINTQEQYWFVAEDDSGEIIGTKLVRAVEEDYKNKGFDKITLTTFGFQAPDFYKKLGYSLEFVREDKDTKLSKYFYCKALKDGKNGKDMD